jgi:hypothetical protein
MHVGATPRVVVSPTPFPQCQTSDGRRVADRLQQYATEWDDALKLADSTSRASLAGPVSELQRIRRDVQAQQWPDCATIAKGLLVGSMDATIDGFLGFMRQDPDYQHSLNTAADLMRRFNNELKHVSGTPRPTPTLPPTATSIPAHSYTRDPDGDACATYEHGVAS